MVVLCKSPTTGGSEAFISMCEPGVTNWVTVEEYVGRYWVWRQGQFSGQQSGALLTVDANWHVHVGVLGDSLAYYRDGIRYGGGEGFTSGTYTTLRIGNTQDVSGPVRYATADVALGLFFNRPLSAAEVWSISQNPWQVFQAPQKKIFTFPAIDVTTRPIGDVSLPNNKIFRRPVTLAQQPQTPPQIDWGNPITKGLLDWQSGSYLNGFTPVNAPTDKASPRGIAKVFSGASTQYLIKSLPTTISTLGTTIVAVARNTTTSGSRQIAGFGSASQQYYVGIEFYVNGISWVKGRTPGATQTSSYASLDQNWHVNIGTISSTTGLTRFYRDGIEGLTGAAENYNHSLMDRLMIGAGNWGGTILDYLTGEIALVLFFRRELTSSEIRSISENPWQVFKNPHSKHISIPDIGSPYERYTPLFFAPSRKKFPSDATPLNLGHPILRGLEQGIIAGPVRNATTRNQYTVRTSIPGAAPFGVGEQLTGSTGYISAPTDASSSTAPWTYIVYGVVPSIGADCALLGIGTSPGSSVYDRSVSLGSSGAVRARIYNPSPYSYDQITTTTKTVTPGVPFLAGAVATGSELIAYLDYNKVSVGAPTAGYPYGGAVLVAGYGGPGQTTSSNATIAYALKLNRAITDAEWNSLVQDPWQIFMPGVKRVLALPTFVSPWTSNISNESLYDDVDDTSTNDGDYIISSPATSGVVGDPVIFNLSKTLPQGTHTVRARAKKSATLGEVRAALLDSNNLPVGTSAWQPLSNTFRTYELAITTTGSASRVKFDTVGSNVSTGIPSSGLVLYYDASNTLSYPGSGTTITDLSGQKRDATFINGPIFISENGGSINFDGIDDYATIAQPLGSLSQATIVVWIKRRGNQPAWASVLWDRNSTTGYSGIGFRGDTINQLTFSWNTYRVTGPILEDNVWYMAALTRANAYNVTGYTYGPSGLTTGVQTGYNGVDSNFNDLRLGIDGTISGRNFKGYLGIALMYNRALSAVEIDGIYNTTKGRFGV
jgi:hypothetical protein